MADLIIRARDAFAASAMNAIATYALTSSLPATLVALVRLRSLDTATANSEGKPE
jgi:hypothetical protein